MTTMADATTPPHAEEKLLAATPFGAKEQYDFSRCTVQLTVTLHPEDGHPKGRLVTLAAWTHGDAPIVRSSRRDEMGGGWPAPIKEILGALRADLPERERLARERQRLEAEKAARDAAAEAKRKEEAAARRSQAARAKPAPKKVVARAAVAEAKPETPPPAGATEPSVPSGVESPAKPAAAPAQGSLFATDAAERMDIDTDMDEEVDDDGEDQV
ncbi:MAG: hypothetical protein U0166_00500 [Acidobacteriota bacterium]